MDGLTNNVWIIQWFQLQVVHCPVNNAFFCSFRVYIWVLLQSHRQRSFLYYLTKNNDLIQLNQVFKSSLTINISLWRITYKNTKENLNSLLTSCSVSQREHITWIFQSYWLALPQQWNNKREMKHKIVDI